LALARSSRRDQPLCGGGTARTGPDRLLIRRSPASTLGERASLTWAGSRQRVANADEGPLAPSFTSGSADPLPTVHASGERPANSRQRRDSRTLVLGRTASSASTSIPEMESRTRRSADESRSWSRDLRLPAECYPYRPRPTRHRRPSGRPPKWKNDVSNWSQPLPARSVGAEVDSGSLPCPREYAAWTC
jgi:hypothetical protein